MKKIFMCAKFGYSQEILDGQSLRSRSIKNYISQNENLKIKGFDSSEISKNKAKSLLKIIINIFNSHKSIFALAHKGTYVIMPLAIIISRFFLKKEIYFVAIGGWLPQYLEKKHVLSNLMKKVTKIYVQTEAMKNSLENKGFQNIEQLLNFRINNYEDFPVKKVENKKIKFVFISRVIKEKGIEDAIKAMNILLEKHKGIDIIFDFYGPLENIEYLNYLKKINKFKEKIVYKGILQPKEIVRVLNSYDAMVFPTYYEGEGFPGVIIDANQSGIAIITTNWKYNKDFVSHKKEGLICSEDRSDLYEKLEELLINPKLLFNMKQKSRQKAKKYDAKNVMKSFEIILEK